jgi:hypothetical protein
LRDGKFDGFAAINRICATVAERYGIFLQVNLPPGRTISLETIGHQDLSILVHRERQKFEGVTLEEIQKSLQPLNPISVDNTGFGYEGLRIRVVGGRIDLLPGGVHLWCLITPQVLSFLDWLFPHAYGLNPA